MRALWQKLHKKGNYLYACAHILSSPKQQSQQKSWMSLRFCYRRQKEGKNPTATSSTAYLSSTQIFSRGAKTTQKDVVLLSQAFSALFDTLQHVLK